MIKMYLAEVLGKLPVIQHFLFGSILPYEGPPAPKASTNSDDPHLGHAHSHGELGETGWGDCCGIPVPSAFGAAQAEKHNISGTKLATGPGIRAVPFD